MIPSSSTAGEQLSLLYPVPGPSPSTVRATQYYKVTVAILHCDTLTSAGLLNCRLSCWSESTATAAATLEQNRLDKRPDRQADIRSKVRFTEVAPTASVVGVANEKAQAKGVRGGLLGGSGHWTSTEPDVLLGGTEEDLASVHAQTSQLQELKEPQHQVVSPVPQAHVLRHRLQPGFPQGKGRDSRGILSLAWRPSSRVAPEGATQEITSPGIHSSSVVVSVEAQNTGHEASYPGRAASTRHVSAGGRLVVYSQKMLKTARPMKCRRAQRLSMHIALQQSIQQVKACTLQFEGQNIQQWAMQQALKGMTAGCSSMHKCTLPHFNATE